MKAYSILASNAPLAEPKEKPELNAGIVTHIYECYYKKVYNYISYRINNHSHTEDLVSQVFEKAIDKYHTYQPDHSPIEAWLMGISKNVVADYYRKTKKYTFVPLESVFNLAGKTKNPDDIVVQDEENRTLIQAMTILKDNERQIIALKFATELKHKDIATIMGISEANVGTILHRAVQKLRRKLEVQNNETL